MSYSIIRTDEYLKKLTKFIRKHPNILEKYAKTIELLELDPYHPSLRLHKLNGKLRIYHSISINIKYRIVIDFELKENEIIPIDIGIHNKVY